MELPPWDAAAARGEEVADDSQEEEDLEPRSTTAVEARAAPAPPAPVPAGSSPVAPPPPGTRPTQSQGVRPAGTVSVAHLHCGLGYYRDQTGRCRRARRPSSSNTRKHHHGTRRHRPAPVQGGAKPAAAAPAATPVSEPVKDLPSKESSVKQAAPVTKDTATKTSAPKQDAIVSDSKESVKEATPISGTPAKDPVGESASPVPAASPLAVAAKPAVKEAVKEPVKEALKEVVKEPVSAHKAQPVKQAPAKQAAAVKVPVQDRIASSGHKASSTVSGNVNVKEAVKMQPVQLKAPPKPPLREAPGVKPQRQQPNKPVAAAVKDKEAPKVSHHHGQHKITVIKEDTKPRSPPAPVKVAVKAASPTAVASPATPVKKN
ncbi:hypothetical protein FOCC_FOCC011895 [Frankliniella occidentalis]|nr:hypothetical protein FOCC_FOCC011895 [Frankliniella occidentalis]